MAPIWTEVGGTAEVSLPFTAAAAAVALTNLQVSRVGGPLPTHGSRRPPGVHDIVLLTKGTKGLVDAGLRYRSGNPYIRSWTVWLVQAELWEIT